ncbi:hypothetical protein B296_00019423, partial [Ensete ventricosum]
PHRLRSLEKRALKQEPLDLLQVSLRAFRPLKSPNGKPQIDTVSGVRWIEEEGTKTLIGDRKHQDRGITYPKARPHRRPSTSGIAGSELPAVEHSGFRGDHLGSRGGRREDYSETLIIMSIRPSINASQRKGVRRRMLKKDRIEMEKKNPLVGVGGEEEEEEEEEEEHEDRCREYRKGNWSLNETMVLIEAKKMDYERRAQRLKELPRGSSGIGSSRAQEMRWKWVEDCCWRHGCYRSQNQCNDRWDNLMRDYKKVRAYELSLSAGGSPGLSYWKLERHERKEKNLPSNLLPEIYEALTEVVQRRAMAEKASGGACAAAARPVQEERQLGGASASMPHSSPGAGSQAPEPPLIAPPLPPYPPPHSRPMATIDSEDSQHTVSPERKRKRGGGSRSNSMELSSAISKCASIIAEALQAGEQKEETRHKDLVSIEERKAKLEESKSEMSSQSMDGLASAINKLASSILGLATDRMQKLQK